MANKLKDKGFDGDTIQATLDALAEDGLQDDGRFVEAFVRGRMAKGQGPQRIRQELWQRGISREDADGCLAGYDWDKAMAAIHGKKFGAAAPASPKDYAARLRFLSQRGFEPSRIQTLLRRLRRSDDS